MVRGATFSIPSEPLAAMPYYRGGAWDYGNSTKFRRRGVGLRRGRSWIGVRRVGGYVRSIGESRGFACGVGRAIFLYSRIGA